MDITNLAKDAIRIANTAGLSKDVIDLLTAKITLLDEKLIETKAAFSDVMLENQELRKKLADLTPVEDGLNEEETKILQFFFREQESSCDAAAHGIGMSLPVATHHVGSLVKQGLIRQSKASIGRGFPAKFRITHDGSAQAMKNG